MLMELASLKLEVVNILMPGTKQELQEILCWILAFSVVLWSANLIKKPVRTITRDTLADWTVPTKVPSQCQPMIKIDLYMLIHI